MPACMIFDDDLLLKQRHAVVVILMSATMMMHAATFQEWLGTVPLDQMAVIGTRHSALEQAPSCWLQMHRIIVAAGHHHLFGTFQKADREMPFF
jgi:hypothetical protein